MWGGECAHKPSLKHIYLLISSCNTDCTHIVHVLFFKKWNTKTGYWVNIWQHVRYTKLITKCTSSSSSSFLFVRYFDLMIITCYFYFLFILIFWGQILLLSFLWMVLNFCFCLMFCLCHYLDLKLLFSTFANIDDIAIWKEHDWQD